MSLPEPPPQPIEQSPEQFPMPVAEGGGEGTASLVFSIIAPCSMFFTIYPSLLAALLTRPSEGEGNLDWVAGLVLWSFPGLFGLLAVTLGISALRVFPPHSSGRSEAVTALWISGAGFAVGLTLVLLKRDLMFLL
ncbi:hypothetical protein F8G81_21490 [Arthrobacter sp. CDRTa11]|uniref:hypothetical protein n=1 Tax=Arthrobacter sp. CDRTa11 TaxID=2651199 RepID=UPI00226590E4|nr:hypothetical protein [Arthrobacter sp. CDRTa11]UZX04880.1 hypothetical protein F8G81_21490 [Arthrobacter sp. CDRTa11]